MYARIKIENVDGSELTEEHSALPIDQIFHTMWSSVDISLKSATQELIICIKQLLRIY